MILEYAVHPEPDNHGLRKPRRKGDKSADKISNSSLKKQAWAEKCLKSHLWVSRTVLYFCAKGGGFQLKEIDL